MSDRNAGDSQNPDVLAQAFPQLENPATASTTQTRADTASHLQVVPTATNSSQNVPATMPPTGLGMFADVPVTLSFEVGRQQITVQQLMSLARGSVLPLQDVFVDSIEVKVGDNVVARAEAVSLKKKVGIRINEIIVPAILGAK